jgi:peptide deformylase
MEQRWEDYASNPNGGTYGISCANLGMAYNIIGFGTEGNRKRFLINPEIIDAEKIELTTTKSNCGSLHLKEKIPVNRPKWVTVRFYDINGELHEETFTGKTGGYTVQHEIDHCNGILITDRFIEQGGDPKLLEKL